MIETMDAFYEWLAPGRTRDPSRPPHEFHDYMRGIAEARSVLRRVLRIIDDQAKAADLEPLQHQLLIQVFGADGPVRVNDLAERLDIAPAFASRLVGQLEERGYVGRERSERDRRISHVVATEAGVDILREIDRNVHVHVSYFHQQLTPVQRTATLGVVAFLVGAPLEHENLQGLGSLVLPNEEP